MVIVEITRERVGNRAELSDEDEDAISGNEIVMEEEHAQIQAQSEFYGVARYRT